MVNEKIDQDSTRIDKIKDIITNLGSAFSSMKNTPSNAKIAKLMYVPINKGETSTMGNADLKAISVHPNFLTILKEPYATNDFLDFVPRSLIINKKEETPKNYSCLIEELPTKDGNTQIYLRFYAQLGALNDNACWEETQFYFYSLIFAPVQ